MRKGHWVTLLLLTGLLMTGCVADTEELSPPIAVGPTPATSQGGPGIWPTHMPAPPSPTVTPDGSPMASTATGQGAATPNPLPSSIPSSNNVATELAPGWTAYESINDIRDLAFAPDGTLWAATSGGLVHWDLGSEAYSRYPIHARALAPAPDGTLWLALEDGVCRFDGESCETYTDADGLIGSDVAALAITPDGMLWVGTDRGVSRFDGHSWRGYPSPVATHDLAVAASGEIWAATAGGIGRYLPAEDAWATYTEEHGLPISQATVIAIGPEDEIWIYLLWQGVYRFDGTDWQQIDGIDGAPVRDIAFEADGTPWVATAGGMHYPGGSLSYQDGQAWIDVSYDQGLHSFTDVAPGPGRVVAASTQLGLGVYQEGEWRLLRDGPTSPWVQSVAVTPDGAAWFAYGDHSVSTPGWGLSRFDGQRWDYHLDDAEVNKLAVAPDGSLWAGVGCSVQRYNGTSWDTIAGCEDLPAGGVLDIAFTPDGATWVANGFGLARYDGEAWTAYERLINSVQAAPDGSVWVHGWEGTQDSFFVARFDGESWTTYESAESYPGGFSVDVVTPDGLLWDITPAGRLISFDGQSWTASESWTYYDIPNGVSLDGSGHLSVAPDGALWLVTERAIARFDREAAPGGEWTVYPVDEGVPASSFHAIAFAPDGAIWFDATRFQPWLEGPE